MSEVMGLRTQILENILALEPQMLDPKFFLYCETKNNGIAEKDKVTDIYTVVLAITERFGESATMHIHKSSDVTPELAYRALLRQSALSLTEKGYIPR